MNPENMNHPEDQVLDLFGRRDVQGIGKTHTKDIDEFCSCIFFLSFQVLFFFGGGKS